MTYKLSYLTINIFPKIKCEPLFIIQASIVNENSEMPIYSFAIMKRLLIGQNIKRYVQGSQNVLYVDTLFKITSYQ